MPLLSVRFLSPAHEDAFGTRQTFTQGKLIAELDEDEDEDGSYNRAGRTLDPGHYPHGR